MANFRLNLEGRQDEFRESRLEPINPIYTISEIREFYTKKSGLMKEELTVDLSLIEESLKRRMEKAINLAIELGAQENYLKNLQRLIQFLAVIKSLHRFPIPPIREEFKKRILTAEEKEKVEKRVEERKREEEKINKIKELGELVKQIIEGKTSIENLRTIAHPQ